MKKAKIILTAIAVLTILGGALAFKSSRFTEYPLWTLSGTTRVTLTTTIGGLPVTYSATVPYCKVLNTIFATDDSPLILTNARLSTLGFVKGTLIGGTATALIPYTACPTAAYFITFVQ